MEETLQHQETTQCIGLPPSGSGSHHPDGPKTDHALTFKLDQLIGADQPHLKMMGLPDRQPSEIALQEYYVLADIEPGLASLPWLENIPPEERENISFGE